MPATDLKTLCLSLIQADTEDAVVRLLRDAGYWDAPSAWRWLGDEEFNYSSVGNQQSRAEQAIVEKLVNAIDAKLIGAARLAGHLPMSGSEPQAADIPLSIQAARARYFSNELKDPEALSRGITVASTGARPKDGNGRPCFTICDDGEGQTPLNMPKTILSLHKGNKDKIKFAQGKFNMGGTGVLEFCGMQRNLQLVVSKRNPALLPPQSIGTDEENWSFTIIRREDPSDGKSSRFSYLAPVGSDVQPRDGGLLSFGSPTLPIFPEKDRAYVREAPWGTLIKLFEYDARKFTTGMMFEDGLMYRARLLLPEPALPIRFHECRGYRGHSGSFDTAMPGLIETLQRDIDSDKRKNVEWYDKLTFKVDEEEFVAKIYLFRDKKAAESYKRDEGLIFTYNGQCHATMTKDFFRRKSVKQDYLWHSLLVFVDCSGISVRAHERLFMNSRDRLRDGDLKAKLEAELEDQLGHHEELRELASERRKRELAEQPRASESMARVLESLLTKNPTLAALLGQGARIKNPHRPESAGATIAGFIGKRFPSYFRFKGHDESYSLVREAHQNSHVRVAFETDASNEYFRRAEQPGDFQLFQVVGDSRTPVASYQRPRLLNGIANLSLSLPPEATVGAQLSYEAITTDPSRVDPFVNRFTLKVQEEREPSSGTAGRRASNASDKGDDRGKDGKGEGTTSDSFLDIPNPIPVAESEWANQEPAFDKFTAIRIKAQPSAIEGETKYDYLLNTDNVYLQSYAKAQPKLASALKLRFSVGMTLVALSILHQENLRQKGASASDSPDGTVDVQDRVAQMTAAIAPFLLPIIESVGELNVEEEAASESAGAAA